MAISIRRILSFDYVIFMDASNHAYGGFISNSNTTEAYGMWSEQEQGHSSTFRELKAIHNVIGSCSPLSAHSKVKLFSDHQRLVLSLIKVALSSFLIK